MARKNKKSFARSKKFDEVEREQKDKLKERAVQKRTGYERDIRTMMRRILAPVHEAEEGTAEITREELEKIRIKLEKLITKTRVLSGNKGVNLNSAKIKIETEKAIVTDYIKGKRELKGKVDKLGEKSDTAVSNDSSGDNNDESNDQSPTVNDKYKSYGFEQKRNKRAASKNSLYKSLGFEDDVDDDETIL